MQVLFGQGKTYLKIDISYLANFTDGKQYRLEFDKKGCDKQSVKAIANDCGGYALFTINFKSCMDSGVWGVKIFEINPSQQLHSTKVQISLNQ